VPSNTLLGLKEDDSLAQRSGTRDQQKACAETDATNGHRGHLPSPQDHQTGFRTQGVSLPVQNLLRDLQFNEVNQVWATDIAYIPMARGFMYLAVIMDWHSRCVLSWRLSNTLEADFCVDALEEALTMDVPGIFNTGQGSQFTSEAFTSVLLNRGVQISMDSAGGLRGQTCSSSGCGGA
jgi:transposase InsO family protein